MKITTGFVAGLLVSLFVSGGAHATVCSTPLGQVDGLLSLDPSIPAVVTTNVTCLNAPSTPFGWNNSSILSPPDPDPDDVFNTSADLTATGIRITMYTGASGGFNSDLVWTLNLLDGALFESITFVSSDFRFDSFSPDNSDTLSFTGEGTSSAVFTILRTYDDNLYEEEKTFTGVFDIEVRPANPVPEPAGWVATLTCLGMLAVVRRRTNKLRRSSGDAMSGTRAFKVLS